MRRLARAWGGTSPRSPLSRLARVSLGARRRCGPRRSYARRWRGSRYVSPVWRRRCCPTRPRSAPRRPRPAGRRAVTSFRHAPCLAAPGVPLRCVVGGATAPGRGRPSAAVVPRASVLPVATGLLMPRARGRARGTPSPPLPDSAPGWTPGLARCGAGPRRLCSHAGRVLRFRRPPGGGRRASSLNASDARRRIAPDGRCSCSESASRRLFLPPPAWPPSAVWPS